MARALRELRQMPRAQLSKINKDVLVESILSAGDTDEHHPVEERLDTIAAELADLRRAITSPDSATNRKLADMQAQIDKQAEVIAQQQSFLEAVDRKERETKLVVLGVPDEEESLAGATSDNDKLRKVWSVIGEDIEIRSHQRLGRRNDSGRKRPILVTVKSKQDRDAVLAKTKRLKDAGEPFGRIYVKKDVHPSVRNEWRRLREAEAVEKQRPENEGCVI